MPPTQGDKSEQLVVTGEDEGTDAVRLGCQSGGGQAESPPEAQTVWWRPPKKRWSGGTTKPNPVKPSSPQLARARTRRPKPAAVVARRAKSSINSATIGYASQSPHAPKRVYRVKERARAFM